MRRAQVLYELLALPYMQGSRLLLIGIANSIDLAQRTLSRMPAQVGPFLQPQTLNYGPCCRHTTVHASYHIEPFFSSYLRLNIGTSLSPKTPRHAHTI